MKEKFFLGMIVVGAALFLFGIARLFLDAPARRDCWVEPEQSDGLDFGEVIWAHQQPVFCGIARNGSSIQRVCIPMRPGAGIECRVGRIKK